MFGFNLKYVAVSRKEALKRGSKFYFGKSCPSQHFSAEKSIRYLHSGNCVSCKGKVGYNKVKPTVKEYTRLAIDHAKPEYVDDYYDTLLD